MVIANRLWITEKPSAAYNLMAGVCSALGVQVTNQPSQRKDGYFALSNGDVIAPLLGHMIEPVFLSPEHQQAKRPHYFSFLPIVRKQFTYQPKPDNDKGGKPRTRGDGTPVPPAQYKIVCDLIKRAREVVNAGDVDREGQLIFDELLFHVGVGPEGRDKPVWRLPLVSSREEDIRKQIAGCLKERNGDPKWVRRRQAALARQHYDAGLGYNASMAYQSVTDYARMSVGRVQTPVISLVVERDRAIDAFVSRNFFVPVVTLQDGTQLRFFRREGAEGQKG